VLTDLGDAPRSGQGSAPVMQMRFSDNQGKTFSAWKEASLGATGDYTTLARFNGLGDVPAFFGRIYEFQISDPVGRIMKRVFKNVP
jgi:hypothetical protein